MVEQHYSLTRAAALLSISVKTLRRLIEAQSIPTSKVGRTRVIRESDLKSLVIPVIGVNELADELLGGEWND